MKDTNATVRRIKFLARMARAQTQRDSGPPDTGDYTHQTVGVSEVSLLLDMPRLPVCR